MIQINKAVIVTQVLWAVMLCLGCKDVAKEIPDSCKPELDEVFEIKIVIDYYRIEAENPNAQDLASIFLIGPSLVDPTTKPMTRVGKDHFQYTCTLGANSNPKTESKAYRVAVDDVRRRVGGFMAYELITVNDTELIKKGYGIDFIYKVFWLDKCKVITE